MKTFIFEGVQNHGVPMNWGKFLVGVPDAEWFRESHVGTPSNYPLLQLMGWTPAHVWVCDWQTGEGAFFHPGPGGNARADLEKHRIHVCPLFEEFLKWLYKQDISRLHQQPAVIELPDAQFSINGYRRPGPHDVSFTLRKGDLMKIEWGGEPRVVVCDGLTRDGETVIRSLTDTEIAGLGRHTEASIEAQDPDPDPDPDPVQWDEMMGDAASNTARRAAETGLERSPAGAPAEPEAVTAGLLVLPDVSDVPDVQDAKEAGTDDVPTLTMVSNGTKEQAGS